MKKNLLKSLLAVALLLVGGNAWGENSYIIGWGTADGDNFTNFAATSGSVSGIVSFSAAKEGASTAPAYNSNSSELRLYFNATGNGGSITLTPASGITITGVVVTTSTCPTVKYFVDEGEAATVSYEGSNPYTYSITGIEASQSLKIQNANSTNNQLRIKTIEIFYTGTVVLNPEISFETESKTIAVGDTYTQEASVVNAEGAMVTYSTSDASVAAVDASTGEVTGVAAGDATITASITVSGTSYTASYSVTVVEVEDGVFDFTVGYDYGSGITPNAQVSASQTFTAGEITITTSGNVAWYTAGTFRVYSGASFTVSAPEGYEITEIAFTGTQYLTNVTVDKGEISGNGTAATWTGKAQNVTITRGSQNPFYNTITVTYGEASSTKEANLTIDATKLAVAGQGTPNSATITSDAEGLVVSYESSDEAVATVNNGVVTAVAAGTATITATWEEQTLASGTYDAGSKEFTVTVYAVEDGVFDFTTLVLDYGSELTPDNGSDYIEEESTWTAGNVTLVVAGKYRWWSNDGTLRLFDPSTITISAPEEYAISSIVITGSKLGGVTSNVGTYENGTWTGFSQSVVLTRSSDNLQAKTITVTYEKEDRETGTASFADESVEIAVGETQTITVTTNSDGAVTYSSSNPGVVSVDAETGAITGLVPGTATITAQVAGTDTYTPAEASYVVSVTFDAEGSGTEADPYTVSDVVTLNNPGTEAWVKGAILGFGYSDTDNNLAYTADFDEYGQMSNNTTNVVIGEEGCFVAVQLPSGAIRTGLNLVDNSSWIGCEVAVYGSLEKYFGAPGVKNVSDFNITLPSVISAAEWATVCLPFNASIATEGVTAYYVSVEDKAVTKTAVEGAVPSGTGVLLNGAAGDVCFAYEAEATAAEGNQLVGSLTGETFNEAGTTYYILANGNDGNGGGNGIGFYWQSGTGGTSAACAQYKAVLAVTSSTASSTGYRLDGTTMVEPLLNGSNEAVIYDITGRQLQSITGRGIYIVNGKKVIVK